MVAITKNRIVGIYYEIKDHAGNTIDSNVGFAPLEYLHGANNILPALEDELEGLMINEEKQVILMPSQTYGEYDVTLVYQADTEELKEGEQQLQEGYIVQYKGKELMIVAIDNGKVSLDGNHLLAGKILNYHVKVITIRAATAVEMKLRYPITPQMTTCGPNCNC